MIAASWPVQHSVHDVLWLLCPDLFNTVFNDVLWLQHPDLFSAAFMFCDCGIRIHDDLWSQHPDLFSRGFMIFCDCTIQTCSTQCSLCFVIASSRPVLTNVYDILWLQQSDLFSAAFVMFCDCSIQTCLTQHLWMRGRACAFLTVWTCGVWERLSTMLRRVMSLSAPTTAAETMWKCEFFLCHGGMDVFTHTGTLVHMHAHIHTHMHAKHTCIHLSLIHIWRCRR